MGISNEQCQAGAQVMFLIEISSLIWADNPPVTVSCRDVNKLILNYLIIEGYMDAAEKFAEESGLQPTVELASIRDRMVIRGAIQSGNIDEAIERINDLDPEV